MNHCLTIRIPMKMNNSYQMHGLRLLWIFQMFLSIYATYSGERKSQTIKILFYPMTWDVPSISGRSCKNKVMLTFIVRLNSYILHAASMPKSRIICIVGEFAPWFQVQMHHIQIILNIHKDVNLHFNAHTSCALQTFPYGGFLLPQRE